MRSITFCLLILLSIWTHAQGTCIAYIYFSNNGGCDVSFSGSGSAGGNITSWDWNFGDGNSSNQQSPYHTYNENGTYSVELTIETDSGCTYTAMETVEVTGCKECSADFYFSDYGCDVSFTDYSISGYATIDSWSWSFGDGGYSSNQNPSHTYSENGTYTVVLDITTTDGCSTSVTHSVDVTNCGADCSADFSYTMGTDCEVQFLESAYTPYGNIVSWEWDLGDGTTTFDQHPVHTYSTNGYYSVSLTIGTSDGCLETSTQSVYVDNCSTTCQAYFSYDNYSGCEVSFTEYAYSEGGTVESWDWDFGDGNTSSDQNPTHTYEYGGTYTVSLTISTSDNCSHTETATISIDSCATDCHASFSYDNYSGCDVSFTEYAYSDGNATIETWSWDFGDGNFSSDQNPTHTYSDGGTYTVSLTITTSDGCTDTESYTMSVDSCIYECHAEYSYDNYSGCEVTFSDYSYSDGGASVDTWNWDFGDGNSSSDQNPTHTYASGGTYTVTLTITTSDNCQDTETFTMTVDSCSYDCHAEYSYDNYSGCEVTFSDYSYSDGGASVDTWNWDFGDGNSSSDQNPTHTYAAGGTYTVTLTITTSDNCQDTETFTMTVDSCSYDCHAEYSYDNYSGCEVTFSDYSYSDGGASVDTWNWDFGDGNSSSDQNPTHTYAAGGTYTVTLTITTSDNCQDTETFTMTVDSCSYDCHAEYSYDNYSGCEVTFSDYSYSDGGASVDTWNWDFGDGNSSSDQNPTHTYGAGGIYTVTLTITTSDNCEDTETFSLSVDSCSYECHAEFSYDNYSGCEVSFYDYSYTDGQGISSWLWTFGDGNSSTDSNPIHSYSENGTFDVTLEIYTYDGCYSTQTQSVQISGCPYTCTADFYGSNTSDCEVSFYDGSYSEGSYIMMWNWNFGDGNYSSDQYPTHQYSENGDYLVTLDIETADGCTSSVSHIISVTNCSTTYCTADFSYAQPYNCEVYFYDNSASMYTISNWTWDFGDGNISNEYNPTYTYSASGDYLVILYIETSDGCTDSISQLITIDSCGNSCDADFGYSYNNDCEISFYDYSISSSGQIASWTWDFGDGHFSSDQNPVHDFGANGLYKVVLYIDAGDGCTDSTSQYIQIANCLSDCYADFSYYLEVDSTCTVSFSDMSSASSPIVSWDWDFGDGHFSTDPYPHHVFSQAGQYTVTLTITTSDGCTDTKEQSINVDNCGSDCYADFSYFVETDSSCTVSFTDMSTTSNPIVSWSWDFGDGHIGSGANPQHIFPQAGQYTVTLVITTSDGCTDSNSQVVYVDQCGADCYADFSYFVETDSSCTVSFTDMSTTSNPIVSWSWDFGDGHIGSGANPQHIFPQAGQYTVTLIITTSDGCTDSNSQVVYVDQCGADCYADFSYFVETDSSCTVSFTDMSTTSNPIVSWSWDFGDGHIGSGANPQHIFPQAGQYTVTLVIMTSDGCTDSNSQVVYVDQCGADCYADFSYFVETDSSCTVSFTDMSTTSNPIVSWSWDFGDGHIGSGANPQHIFPQAGQYTVTLVITTSDGCTDSNSQVVYVDQCGADCYADFSYFVETDSSCTVSFTDMSTTSNPIVSWSWDFGDGHIGSGANPQHIFPQAGQYTVTLVITTSDGCTDSNSQVVYVDQCGADCYADFSYFVETDSSCTVSFTDMSTTSNPIVSWSWDFGDGHIGSGANPQHIFPQAGQYTVTLVITTSDGCTDSNSQVVYVDQCGADCYADFSYFVETDSSCTVSFTDMSTTSNPIVSWNWDFGDGHIGSGANPQHIFPQAGQYTVTLVITTSDGCTDSNSQVVYVDQCGTDCYADFSYFVEVDTCLVSFTDMSSTSYPIIKWDWDFGDGHSSTEQNPVHDYGQNGDYQVKLIIETADSCKDTVTQLVHVDQCNPTPDCQAEFSYEKSGWLVYFTDHSTGEIESWDWDFGDGGTSRQANPIHFFNQVGIYVVHLTIQTTDGCISTISKTIVIDGCGNDCKADFAYETDLSCTVSFVNFSTSNGEIISWEWDFGDGQSADEPEPTHVYDENGVYNVKLIITTADGCSDDKEHSIQITNCGGPVECQAGFHAEKDSLDPLTWYFDDRTEDLFGQAPVKWLWEFGDGDSAFEADPVHSYSQIGPYTVKLTVSFEDSCQASQSMIIQITTILGEALLARPVKMYPNPTTGLIQVEASFTEAIRPHWELLDLTGRHLIDKNVEQNSLKFSESLDISELAEGVYFFQIRTAEGLIYRNKIVKQ